MKFEFQHLGGKVREE